MSTDPPTLLPFTRSYWASPARLLGGFYPGDRDPAVTEAKLTGLLDCGVSHIINLMEAEEGDHAGRAFISYKESFLRLASQRGRRVIWMRHPIRDLCVPTPAQMTGTLDAIDQAIAMGGCVYVHCWGGRGRTGTVIGCWLARHGAPNALSQLRDLTAHERRWFPNIPETAAQQTFVREWRAGR